MSVIISNGFNKFHLAAAASSVAEAGALTKYLTGAYPTESLKRFAEFLPHGAQAKFLGRHEDIPPALVHSLWSTEMPHFLGLALEKSAGSTGLSQNLIAMGMALYARAARRIVQEAAAHGARIYHYRAGYGGLSVDEAKRNGLIAVCDHSIAHPALLDHLVRNGGSFPDKALPPPRDPFWRPINNDIDRADIVLVNSDFVASTFAFQKFDMKKVRVIYLGVDDQFLSSIPQKSDYPQQSSGPVRLLFAGGFNRRKGAAELLEALTALTDMEWELSIAGHIDPEIKVSHSTILANPRIRELGWVSRTELARHMSESEIFVFPSLAEGSARVVFEALACGAYVITTPNAGSILRHGEHGALVPPGNAQALASALREAFRDRHRLHETGRRNATIVQAEYRQSRYGEQLMQLYKSSLAALN